MPTSNGIHSGAWIKGKKRYQLLKAKAENKYSCMVEVFREKFWRLGDKVLSLPSDSKTNNQTELW